MSKLLIKQTKSIINKPERIKRTIKALGLGRPNYSREIEASPQVLGMIAKVKHLLTVEEIK